MHISIYKFITHLQQRPQTHQRVANVLNCWLVFATCLTNPLQGLSAISSFPLHLEFRWPVCSYLYETSNEVIVGLW